MDKLKQVTGKTAEERVQATADQFWSNDTPDTALKIEDTGETYMMTKQEYIEYALNKENQYKVRGSLFDLAVQYALSPKLEDKKRIQEEFESLASTITGRYSDVKYYAWIFAKPSNVSQIIDRLNLNILDGTENPDKFILQPILSNNLLKIAGTPDVLISHGKHEYSIVDLKAGFAFNNTTSSMLLKFGRSIHRDIYQNPRDLAHMQLTLYAVLLKMADPEATFKDLKVAWITDEEQLFDYTDFRAYTDLANTLPVIEAFMRSEYKDLFPQIQKEHPNLFKASAYQTYSRASERLMEQGRDVQVLEKLTQEVQYLNMYKKTKIGESLRDDIDDLLTGYIEFTPDTISKTEFDHVKDLSFGEYMTGSVHNIKNPYIKLFQSILDRQFTEVQRELASKMYPMKDLTKELYIQYMKNRDQNIVNTLLSTPSRLIVGFGTGASKILNRLDHNDMWG